MTGKAVMLGGLAYVGLILVMTTLLLAFPENPTVRCLMGGQG